MDIESEVEVVVEEEVGRGLGRTEVNGMERAEG